MNGDNKPPIIIRDQPRPGVWSRLWRAVMGRKSYGA